MFTTAVLLVCLLQPPAKPDAKPPTPPPTFAKITSGETKDSLLMVELQFVTKQQPYTITVIEKVSMTEVLNGKTVVVEKAVPVTKTAIRNVTEAVPVTKTISTKSHKLVDLDGREVSWLLHENKSVLVTTADGLGDDYKAMFKLGTLVLVPLKNSSPEMPKAAMPAPKP